MRAAPMPGIHLQKIDLDRMDDDGAQGCVGVHGRDGKGVQGKHVPPRLQELQPFLQGCLHAPHWQSDPIMGQSPRQTRYGPHL